MENNERLTWTAREVSKLTSLAVNSVYQGIATGQIPHIRIGKRILIPKAALLRMLADAEAKAQKTV